MRLCNSTPSSLTALPGSVAAASRTVFPIIASVNGHAQATVILAPLEPAHSSASVVDIRSGLTHAVLGAVVPGDTGLKQAA